MVHPCEIDDVTDLIQKQLVVRHRDPNEGVAHQGATDQGLLAENRSIWNPTQAAAASLLEPSEFQENAEAETGDFITQNYRHIWLLAIIGIESAVLFITMALPIFLWVVAAAIGRSVDFGLETCDRLFLGTEVTIRRLETNILQGVIIVDTLQVQNPETDKYNSPYLLKARLVQIELDMVTLICSFFRHVKIDRLDFKDVDVIYEKSWNSSNVHDTMNFLKGNGGAPDNSDCGESREDQNKTASGVRVTLHEVMMDVGARVQAQMFGGRSMRVAVGDVVYRDFEAEVGESTPGPIIQVLLKSVLKTVMTTIVGKHMG